jgi:PAS domain S-box-containing protein
VITNFDTEFKVEEVKLRNVISDLARLIDTANAPIFGIDTDGKVNEWNQTAAKITKYSKEEVMGKDLVQTYISQEFRKSVAVVMQNALKGIDRANFPFVMCTKHGSRVEILMNATTRRDSCGSIIGVVGVGQDITDLTLANERGRHSADEFARVIDTVSAPIFGTDCNGMVNLWNHKVVQITGKPMIKIECPRYPEVLQGTLKYCKVPLLRHRVD